MGIRAASSATRRRLGMTLTLAALAAVVIAIPAAAQPGASTGATKEKEIWADVAGQPAPTKAGKKAAVKAKHLRAFTLDRKAAEALLAGAPKEKKGKKGDGLTVTIPAPNGDLLRFALQESSVLEPAAAARHPEIKTYLGVGLDDPAATVRADLTPLGFHASVRSPKGNFYVDPYYQADESLYVSYFTKDAFTDEPFVEREGEGDPVTALAESLEVPAGPVVKLRTYRLALVTDPSYATYFGAANVTAAKTTLINRVTQIYEDEMAVRLVLVNDTDKTNLNTTADATGANGPCGAAACFTAAQITTCGSGTLLNGTGSCSAS